MDDVYLLPMYLCTFTSHTPWGRNADDGAAAADAGSASSLGKYLSSSSSVVVSLAIIYMSSFLCTAKVRMNTVLYFRHFS